MAKFSFFPFPPELVKEEGNTGIIEIKGLYPGYGITIANPLRRVLLSSIEGGAITAVKINGVSHEFSTIPYVYEDTVAIILNLKKIRLRLNGMESATLVLNAKGGTKVFAKDINTPEGVEIINKDLYLFSITNKKGEVSMELTAEKGFGYMPLDRVRKEKLPIGTILLDAYFSPVRSVNYRVEDMRIGERTDFNKIVLEIETDGSITPFEAFKKSCQILKEQFESLLLEKRELKEKEVTVPQFNLEEILNSPIDSLNLSTKTYNALKKGKIRTIKKLVKKNPNDLLRMERFGQVALNEVKNALSKYGLGLKE